MQEESLHVDHRGKARGSLERAVERHMRCWINQTLQGEEKKQGCDGVDVGGVALIKRRKRSSAQCTAKGLVKVNVWVGEG